MSLDSACSARRVARATLTIVLLVLVPHDSYADGWKVQLQGVKALGLSYAGRSILLDDASTIWFNPAGMTRLEDPWTITTAAPFINYSLDYADRGSRSFLNQPMTGASSVDGGRSAAVPHVYVARKVNDRWWAGFGFNAPFGLGNDYGETWVGRYHATLSELTVLNLNPVVAVKLTERVSLGFGFDLQRSDTTLANMIDFGSLGAALGLPFTPQQHDGRIELEAGDWAAGYDLSVAWNVSQRARLGATYRSQIEHQLDGTADFTVPQEALALTGGVLFSDTGAATTLPMPHELSVSAAYDIDARWTVVGDVTWTDWSRFQQLAVTFDNAAQPSVIQDALFDDSVRSAVGVVFKASDTWELRTGALYETSPVPDATRTPRLPEGDHSGFSLGGTYRMGRRAELDFSFSHLIPHDASIQLQDPAAGLLTGSVRWRLDILAVALTLKL